MMVQHITINKIIICILAFTLSSSQAFSFNSNENKSREHKNSHQTFHNDGFNLKTTTSSFCHYGYSMMNAGASFWETQLFTFLGDWARDYTTSNGTNYGS